VDTPYRWQGLRFLVPAGVVDDTLLTFQDQKTPPRFNVTVTKDAHTGPLLAYAQGQEQALVAERLPGYQAEPPRPHTPAGVETVVCKRRFAGRDGATVVQQQAFARIGGEVAIITATANEAGAPAAAVALSSLLASLQPAPERA
jgi:hypothetical protein